MCLQTFPSEPCQCQTRLGPSLILISTWFGSLNWIEDIIPRLIGVKISKFFFFSSQIDKIIGNAWEIYKDIYISVDMG